MRNAARWAMWAGIALTLLFATGHFLRFLAGRRTLSEDPAFAEVASLMRSKSQRVLGMEANPLDYREYLSANLSILLVVLVAAMAAELLLAADRARSVRVYAAIGLIVMVILLVTSLLYPWPREQSRA